MVVRNFLESIQFWEKLLGTKIVDILAVYEKLFIANFDLNDIYSYLI